MWYQYKLAGDLNGPIKYWAALPDFHLKQCKMKVFLTFKSGNSHVAQLADDLNGPIKCCFNERVI